MGHPVETWAPHLAHAEGSAWFDPIPLGASFPNRIQDGNLQTARVYLHEYTHFLQSCTTFYGANRMHSFFWSISDLSKLFKLCAGQLASLDKLAFEKQLHTKLAALNTISKAHLLENDNEPLFASSELRGFHAVNDDGEQFPAYFRSHDSTKAIVTPISIAAIEESMAMAVECWADPSGTRRLYAATKALENWAVFKYSVVREALVGLAPRWAERTIVWMTVVVCDVALNHYLPLHALILVLGFIPKRWHDNEPSIANLAVVHAELTQACLIEIAEVDRTALLTELKRVVARPSDDSAPFDWIFARYLQLYISAMELRRQRPHAFAERLLKFDEKCEKDLSDFEHIPYYTVRGNLISTHFTNELATAGLAIICLQDFSKAILKAASSASVVSRCPLLDRPGTCAFEKGEHCKKSPWLAPIFDGKSCIYRFATDAVGVYE